jgi:outer membrane protein assembly factor BamB
VAAAGCAGGHSLALLSARSGTVLAWPRVRGAAGVAADGRRAWFVFARGPRCPSPYALWHLRANGAIDPSWRPIVGARPAVVARGTLYDLVRHGVEARDARTGALRWRTRANGFLSITSVAPTARAVYVGGDFTGVAGAERHGLAALDPRTGRVLPWHAPPFPTVFGVASVGAKLLVGGEILGRGASGLVAVDARTGKRLRNYGDRVGDVERLVVAHGLVFTAGRDGFGITRVATGALDPLVRRIRGVASTFASSGRVVYLAGEIRNGFDAVDGKRRNNLAAVDLATGRLLSWAPDLAKFVAVGSLAADARAVAVAGSFTRSLG